MIPTHQVTARFEPHGRSAAAARHFVRSVLVVWDRAPAVDVVVLLTSEVVGSVIRHAGPHDPKSEVAVTLSRTADQIRVDVADDHPGFFTLGGGLVDRPSGQGLLLLDALADAWGVTQDDPGKVVWFEIRL
jgi:anti-sigma regulatory factor (Ser/Thr protein kinase)